MSRRYTGAILTSGVIQKSGIWTMQQYTQNMSTVAVPPFTSLLVEGVTTGATTGTFVPTQSTVIVYGCGGGGNGGYYVSANSSGCGGGGGAASQLTGYSLTVTPGETLSYSVGGPAQSTYIMRGATVIFELNPGSSPGDSAGGGAGGTSNSYSSHAGGAGGNGSPRWNAGVSASSVTGCAGGGGGGGFGDNSPLIYGYQGGNGGTSSVTGSIMGGVSGATGGAYVTAGGNKLLAYGGTTIDPIYPWHGGGGGAGGGIRVLTSSSSNYFGAGGGGNGSYGPGTTNKGGPGLLYVVGS